MKSLTPLSAFSLLILCLLPGCLFEEEVHCHLSTDCPDGLFCHMGRCADLGQAPPGGGPLVKGPDSPEFDPDQSTEVSEEEPEPHPCPDALLASDQNLILNEIFAFVPTGPQGDANGDGVRHAHDDEFIELVNLSDQEIDLTGVIIHNDTSPRFTFPPFCLPPLHAVVVFGGLQPGAFLPFGEAWESFVADSRFSLANGGGRVLVTAANGDTIADFTYGSHPAVSLNLSPDLNGTTYVPHTDLHPEAIFSPGTCADGRPFTSLCLP